MTRAVVGDLRGFCLWTLLIGFATIGASSLTTAAQAPRRGQPGGPGALGAQQAVTPGELQDLFDSYVMLQAQRQLRLSDDQLPPFILRLKALQAARRRGENQRLRIIQDLRRLTQADDGNADEAQIRDRLKMLDDVDARTATEVKQALVNLDQVLDVRQQARLRILEEQMERNKVQLMMRARQRANPLGGQ